jgi:hypothetical protein
MQFDVHCTPVYCMVFPMPQHTAGDWHCLESSQATSIVPPLHVPFVHTSVGLGPWLPRQQ